MPRRPLGRLRQRRHFEALRRSSSRARSGPIRAVYAPLSTDPPFPLVGYAVGRRCGGAVQRNQLRRRMRAAASEVAPDLAAGAYLLSSEPEATVLPYRDLAEAVRAALVRAATVPENSRRTP